MNVFKLEKYLIPPERWNGEVPNFVRDKINPEDDSPIGFGYTKETGWFILGTGQGPFLIWKEK